jgi:glycerophosphoryl diester phosphodiesterase
MLLRLTLMTLLFTAGTPAAWAQKLIAHRGASADAPENTLAAFRLAFEQGADGIEGDYYLTRDGQIVCIHDSNTSHTGDKALDVAASTLDELRQVDVGSKKDKRFAGEKIPTLAEVLAVVPVGKEIYIEIKCGPEILPPLKRGLAQSKLEPAQIAIIGFGHNVIAEARKQLPNLRAYHIVGFGRNKETGQLQPALAGVIDGLKTARASGLDAGGPADFFTPEAVRAVHDAGFEFHCWTIDDEPTARHLQQLSVDSITTNRPAALRQWLFDTKAAN